MRNVHGVEIKKGHWVSGRTKSGRDFDGRLIAVDRHGEKATIQERKPTPNNDGTSVVWVDDILQTLGPMTLDADGTVRQNPLTRVRIKSPPQRPAGNSSAPSKRLIKRRKATAKAPRGVYANPLVKPIRNRKAALTHYAPDTMRSWNDHFIVQWAMKESGPWDSIGVFAKRSDAETFARGHARKHPSRFVRVVTPD